MKWLSTWTTNEQSGRYKSKKLARSLYFCKLAPKGAILYEQFATTAAWYKLMCLNAHLRTGKGVRPSHSSYGNYAYRVLAPKPGEKVWFEPFSWFLRLLCVIISQIACAEPLSHIKNKTGPQRFSVNVTFQTCSLTHFLCDPRQMIISANGKNYVVRTTFSTGPNPIFLSCMWNTVSVQSRVSDVEGAPYNHCYNSSR